VIMNAGEDGFNSRGNVPGCHVPGPYCDYTAFWSENNVQGKRGMINCSTEIRSLDHWQPLIGQMSLMPQTGLARTFALDLSSLIPSVIHGPPRIIPNSASALNQTMQIVAASSALNDELKAIAVFWSNYPNGANEGNLHPAGYWMRTALLSLITRQSDTIQSVKLLHAMGHAMKDAAIGSWFSKSVWTSVRPIQLTQCLLEPQGLEAWKGPYQGVGSVISTSWNPFLATPPFPGYLSGHPSGAQGPRS
jgi:hypothetical protein